MIPMSAVGNAGANPNRKISLDNSEEDIFMFPRPSSHMNLKQQGSGSFSFRNCSPWFNDPCWFCGLSTSVCPVRNCQVRLTTSPPINSPKGFAPINALVLLIRRKPEATKEDESIYAFFCFVLFCFVAVDTGNLRQTRVLAKLGSVSVVFIKFMFFKMAGWLLLTLPRYGLYPPKRMISRDFDRLQPDFNRALTIL